MEKAENLAILEKGRVESKKETRLTDEQVFSKAVLCSILRNDRICN